MLLLLKLKGVDIKTAEILEPKTGAAKGKYGIRYEDLGLKYIPFMGNAERKK